MSTLDEGPVEKNYRETMNLIANVLEGTLNPDGKLKTCFTLLVTEFGDHGRCNYISNGRKEDIMCMMKELVLKYEAETGKILHPPQ